MYRTPARTYSAFYYQSRGGLAHARNTIYDKTVFGGQGHSHPYDGGGYRSGLGK